MTKSREDIEASAAYFATLDGKDWDSLPERPFSAAWNRFWLVETSKEEYRARAAQVEQTARDINARYAAAREAADKAVRNLKRT